MFIVRGKCEIYHLAKQMDHEYMTPCGRVVPETLLFDEPQDDLPVPHLVPHRPEFRRLCLRCEFVSKAQAREEARKTLDSAS
jgi:hypothetical protein